MNRNPRIASASFDRQRGILYVFEPEAYGYGSPLVHVWEVGTTSAPEPEPGTVMIEAFSPVDLVITDPLGRTIGKDTSEIPSATYIEIDQNNDGEPDDIVMIPNALLGEYSVEVVPEPGAEPTETYTLRARYSDGTITVASSTMIQNIPPEPYSFFFPQCRLGRRLESHIHPCDSA